MPYHQTVLLPEKIFTWFFLFVGAASSWSITSLPLRGDSYWESEKDKVADEKIAERHYSRGAKLLGDGRPEEAILAFGKAIQIDPSLAKAWCDRGVSWSRVGNHQKAVEDYTRAIEIDSNYALAIRNRALAWRDMKRPQKAIQDLSMAIKLEPKNVKNIEERALLLFSSADYQLAINDYSRALKLSPKNPLLWNGRGASWGRLNEHSKAIDDYSEAIKFDPNSTLALRNRHFCYKALGNNQAAIKDLSRIIELNPESQLDYAKRAKLHLDSGSYREAIADFTKLLAMKPERPEHHLCDRGVCWSRLNDNRKAVADYTEAIAIDREYELAFRNRSWARIRLGQYAEATGDAIAADLLKASKMSLQGKVKDGPAGRLLDNLDALLDSAHSVDIVLRVPIDSNPLSTLGEIYVFERDQDKKIQSLWRCRKTGFAAARELYTWMKIHSEKLETSESGKPNESAFFKGYVCHRLVYRPARSQTFPVSNKNSILVSPQALKHFSIECLSTYPSERFAVIVGEAHDNLEGQLNVLRGLERLFEDNPWLKGRNATAFLTEAWPANKPLRISPLVRHNAKPDDDEIFHGLASWLITGYIAFEWKHQFGIPFIGHEDAEFYRQSNYLHWSIPRGIHKDEQLRKASTLDYRFVSGRNASSGKTLVEALTRFECPILFIGLGHVGPYQEDDQWVENPLEKAKAYVDVKSLQGVVPEKELIRLSKTSHQSVVSYLKQEKIGFVLLMPRNNPARRSDVRAKEANEYLILRQKQHEGKAEQYIKSLAPETTSCTVIPSPSGAAKLLAAGFRPNPFQATSSRSRQLLAHVDRIYKQLLPEARLKLAEKAELKKEAETIRQRVQERMLNRGESKVDAEYIGLRAKNDFLRKWSGRLNRNPEIMQNHAQDVVEEAARILQVDLDELKVQVFYQKQGVPDPRVGDRMNSDGRSYFIADRDRRIVVMGSQHLNRSRAMQLSVACHELIHVLQYNHFLTLNLGTVDNAELWAWQARFGKGDFPNPVAAVPYAERERDAELRSARAVRKYFSDYAAYRLRVFREAIKYSQFYRDRIEKHK